MRDGAPLSPEVAARRASRLRHVMRIVDDLQGEARTEDDAAAQVFLAEARRSLAAVMRHVVERARVTEPGT